MAISLHLEMLITDQSNSYFLNCLTKLDKKSKKIISFIFKNLGVYDLARLCLTCRDARKLVINHWDANQKIRVQKALVLSIDQFIRARWNKQIRMQAKIEPMIPLDGRDPNFFENINKELIDARREFNETAYYELIQDNETSAFTFKESMSSKTELKLAVVSEYKFKGYERSELGVLLEVQKMRLNRFAIHYPKALHQTMIDSQPNLEFLKKTCEIANQKIAKRKKEDREAKLEKSKKIDADYDYRKIEREHECSCIII